MKERKLLEEIARNTRPKPTSESIDIDPDAPQQVYMEGGFNCSTKFTGATATGGLVLRPPDGTYYRLVTARFVCVTGAGSANNELMAYVCTDKEHVAEGTAAPPVASTFEWVSPILATSHTVRLVLSPSFSTYVFYEQSAGNDWYLVPFPDMLITNDRPLRFASAPVNGDTVYLKVVYEVVRT